VEQTTVNKRYRVNRRIAEGGMAVVYLGHDLLLNRPVAIKALHDRFSQDAQFRTRFEREAQAAAGFTHPNIIEIYDVGEENGAPYIVMEYVVGETLKEIIQQEGPFDPDDVAALLEQVGSALDYAHERGLVHRDVKPQNILVDRDGLAKVVDFGIAHGVDDSSLTEVGIALGTAHYVSPEQASGLMPTLASDIYSLGVIAFEMLTQHLPFEGDTPVSIAIQHIEQHPPPPSVYRPYLSPSVDHIVQRALAKNPTLRYRSAGAFAAAMSNWREGAFADIEEANNSVPVPSMATAAISSDDLQADEGRHAPFTEPNRKPAPSRPPKDALGPGTWIAGALVLLALIGLIWFGAYVSEGRFGSGGDGRPLATPATSVPEANVETGGGNTAPAVAGTATDDESSQVTVPNVVGMELSEAISVLTGEGLLTDEGQPVYDPGVPAGQVAEQDPPAGTTIERGRSVLVKVSLGSPQVNLTQLELNGRPADMAAVMLRDRGLNVRIEEIESAEVAPGAVIRTDPESTAMIGDTVTLIVSDD
jgi:predicted Ser/Thr protein kinase